MGHVGMILFIPAIISYSSYITLFLHSFYTRSHPTDLETHRWGLFHALDRHLVPNECPDVVDSVPRCGEFPVLNVRSWAKLGRSGSNTHLIIVGRSREMPHPCT